MRNNDLVVPLPKMGKISLKHDVDMFSSYPPVLANIL
jgi:hypothetical protein